MYISMAKSLNDEYEETDVIYTAQQKYRQTEKGKFATKRVTEKQLLKKMTSYHCIACGENEFEVLSLVGNKTLCYNCKYRRVKVLSLEELQC